MKKPLILITGGQACDRHFRGKSYTLNKTYPAAVIAAGGLPVLGINGNAMEDYAALCDGCICSGAQIFTPEYSLVTRVDNEERKANEQRAIHAFMAAGKRSTRAISRAAAFSGLMAMESPSSSRIKRSCFSYSGFRIRAMV